jgi:hypothetical protein
LFASQTSPALHCAEVRQLPGMQLPFTHSCPEPNAATQAASSGQGTHMNVAVLHSRPPPQSAVARQLPAMQTLLTQRWFAP